jgi:hypothetical protein
MARPGRLCIDGHIVICERVDAGIASAQMSAARGGRRWRNETKMRMEQRKFLWE